MLLYGFFSSSSSLSIIPLHYKIERNTDINRLFNPQNEYAALLAKRVNEEKAKKSELRSKFLSPSFPSV
jgi:hypothetical protein